MTSEQTFVIGGAGLAGAKAAETLRAEGFAGRLVLIGGEAERPPVISRSGARELLVVRELADRLLVAGGRVAAHLITRLVGDDKQHRATPWTAKVHLLVVTL